MKNKKLFILMLAVLATAACAGAVGCEKESKPSVVVNIHQESETLNVLGETTLTVSTENATADVVWSSSDEAVATVKDGVVTALNVGTVTITAKVNGVSDTCAVEVVRSMEAPVLKVSRTEISVEKNGEYTVSASIYWLGEDVTDKVPLHWELGAGAKDGVASVTSAENGKAVVKGIADGETEYYVSATVGDVYVNQKLSITVCDSSVWFESDEMAVGSNGKFLFQMNSIDADGNSIVADTPIIKAYTNDGEIPNVSYVWTSSDESVVKIENGKFVAQRTGAVDVYGEYEGQKVIVTVSVEPSVIRLDQTLTFEHADLKAVALDARTFGSGEVYLEESKIGFLENGEIMLEESKYPTASKELGKRELVAKTDQATYIIPTNLYSMYIETAEELSAWHAHAYANGDDGYYALANHIAFNGTYTGSRNWDSSGYYWANPDTTGFKGIFDGNGYIIDGLRIEEGYRGFITLLQSTGVLKNVSFINASHSANSAYLCTWGCGTIENVYVQYAKDGGTGKNAFGGVFMSVDHTRGMTNKMTIKNCFVDASQTTLSHYRQSYIGGYMKYDGTAGAWVHAGAYAKLQDVYVVAPAKAVGGSDAMFIYNDVVEDSANYGMYTSAEEMAADSAVQTHIAAWDNSFWGVKNGMPTPISVIERGDPLVVTIPASSAYYTFKGGMSVYPGEDYTFTVTPKNAALSNFFVTANGVTLTPVNGVYTVSDVQGALDIDVVHGYVEVRTAATTATYEADTDTWKLSKAVFASYEGVRAHGDAYISKEYIESMMSQGYTKVQFTIQPDGVYAVQACYKYNGSTRLATTTGEAVLATIDLTVASELEFWGQNSAGSGNAIKNEDCYVTITGLTFLK